MWTQFAATGNPNGAAELGNVVWNPVTDGKVPICGINITNNELSFEEIQEFKRTLFWDNLIRNAQESEQ